MSEAELSHYIVKQHGALTIKYSYDIYYKACLDKKDKLTINYVGLDGKKYTLLFDTIRLLHQYMQFLSGDIDRWEQAPTQTALL